MPTYEPIWLEIARQQYSALSAGSRELVDAYLENLLEDPTGTRDTGYNERSDQWSIPLADDGFLFYAVTADPPRVIVLRIVTGLR